MGNQSISRFAVPKLEDLPEDMQKRIEGPYEKLGFVPNVFLVLGHRPDELRVFIAYHDLLMEHENNLTPVEKEMIVVVSSAANHCDYCIMSHGAILRILSKNPLISDQIANNYLKSDVTPRQSAMLDFALKIALSSSEIDESDFAVLRKHGFSDEDIWDIGAITSFFAMSNRMAGLTGMRPNDEFYSLGRSR